MSIVTNYDLFEELYSFIQEGNSMEETLKEYGGGTYYIPSYKTICRNDGIIQDYLQMQKNGDSYITRSLSKKYELSTRQIQKIIKAYKEEVDG